MDFANRDGDTPRLYMLFGEINLLLRAVFFGEFYLG
jgi:hypothetical protein